MGKKNKMANLHHAKRSGDGGLTRPQRCGGCNQGKREITSSVQRQQRCGCGKRSITRQPGQTDSELQRQQRYHFQSYTRFCGLAEVGFVV